MSHEVDPGVSYQQARVECPFLANLQEEKAQALFDLEMQSMDDIERQIQEAILAAQQGSIAAEAQIHNEAEQQSSGIGEWSFFGDNLNTAATTAAAPTQINHYIETASFRERQFIYSEQTTRIIRQLVERTEVKTEVPIFELIQADKESNASDILPPVVTQLSIVKEIPRSARVKNSEPIPKRAVDDPKQTQPVMLVDIKSKPKNKIKPVVFDKKISPKEVMPASKINKVLESKLPAKNKSMIPIAILETPTVVKKLVTNNQLQRRDESVSSDRPAEMVTKNSDPKSKLQNILSLDESLTRHDVECETPPVDDSGQLEVVPFDPARADISSVVLDKVPPIITEKSAVEVFEIVREKLESIESEFVTRANTVLIRTIDMVNTGEELSGEALDSLEAMNEELLTVLSSTGNSETARQVIALIRSARNEFINVQHQTQASTAEEGTHESKSSQRFVDLLSTFLIDLHSAIGSVVLLASRRPVAV